ncbi:hypothetical protein ACOME3_000303 [Neoechinorhynchus agilis]
MEIDGTNMRKSDDGYSDGSDSPPSPIPPRRLRTISASDRFCRNSKLRRNITTDSISIPDIVRFLPRNVLKRIPKGARYLVAKAFTGLLNDCLQTNCGPSWTRLFAFPRLVLCTSGDSGVSLTSTIKERLASFEQIFNDFERNLRDVRKGRTKEEFRCRFSKRSLTERVSSKLADGDVRGLFGHCHPPTVSQKETTWHYKYSGRSTHVVAEVLKFHLLPYKRGHPLKFQSYKRPSHLLQMVRVTGLTD